MDLIDRTELLKRRLCGDVVCWECPFCTELPSGKHGCKIEERIKSAPTVNAVEVVQCIDCKHYWENIKEPDEVFVCLASAKNDAFCSEGERIIEDE